MFRTLKLALSLFALALVFLTGSSSAAPANPQPSGINVDYPFPQDKICGFKIVVKGSKPTNLYTGERNPWGAPSSITETSVGSGVWEIIYGGPKGPCFYRNDPRFWADPKKGPCDPTNTFLGLHFGFTTDDPTFEPLNTGGTVIAPAWVYGSNGGLIPVPGLTGHGNFGGVLVFTNVNAQALSLKDAQIAVVQDMIEINRLTRNDLPDLPWEPLTPGGDLPPGSNESPGTLAVQLPESVRQQKAGGWAIVSYRVVNPETGEVYTTSTLEFPLK